MARKRACALAIFRRTTLCASTEVRTGDLRRPEPSCDIDSFLLPRDRALDLFGGCVARIEPSFQSPIRRRDTKTKRTDTLELLERLSTLESSLGLMLDSVPMPDIVRKADDARRCAMLAELRRSSSAAVARSDWVPERA